MSAAWEIDVLAVRDAKDFLDVALPVEFKRVGAYRIGGNYRPLVEKTSDGRFRIVGHEIHVTTTETRDGASRVVWHELTHAAQYERLFGEERTLSKSDLAAHYHRRAATPYRDRPMEIEAFAAMDLHDDLPLTRAPGARLKSERRRTL